MFCIVAYDVPDDKRRLKVMNTLKDFGTRVQYSVFECHLPKPEHLTRLRARLQGVIVPDEDDVRFYFLCEGCQKKVKRLGHRHALRPPEEFKLI